nr:aldehyde dehydrogenase [Polaromonas sp.]
MISSINPANDQLLAEFADHTESQIESRLAQGAKAQKSWAQLDVQARRPYLNKVAATLRQQKEALARIISLE